MSKKTFVRTTTGSGLEAIFDICAVEALVETENETLVFFTGREGPLHVDDSIDVLLDGLVEADDE